MHPRQSIGHYRILSKLGEGGMGAVYRATDTRLNRDVAIKVLPEAFAKDSDRMQRFEREAQVLAALNHPNIAQIYGIEAGAIVMELVEGADLAGPLPLDTALELARQITAGLQGAHEKGIVHRDLKPANIKVTPEGTVKILDFGLAKTADAGTSSLATSPTLSPTVSLAMTQAGTILGTAAYMSPEQARGKVTDKRADIWAFGVVLYEMITGRCPFEGEDISHTMAAVIMQEPNYDGIPARVQRLLRACLQKDPRKRLHDIADVWHLLDDPPAATTTIAAPAPARMRRGLIAWVGAALALAAAGGLAFVHFREQPAATPVTRFDLQFASELMIAAAISPDGRQIVAATHLIGQGSHLVVRSLDTLETRVLPGTDGANLPFWSPDSHYVGFEVGIKLKIIDVRGGPPQTLDEVPQFRGGTWSSTGTILYAATGASLRQIRASGGTPAAVPAGSLTAYVPSFLPDGRHFLFTTSTADGEKGGIYVGSLDARDPEHEHPRRVLPDLSRAVAVRPSRTGQSGAEYLTLLFVREATLMGVDFHATELRTSGDVYPIAERIARQTNTGSEGFSVSDGGTLIYETQEMHGRKLTWYDREGKVTGTVDELGGFRSLALSPDGTRLAADRQSDGNYDIWLYDLARNSKIRLTSDPTPEQNPVWSKDGKWVAFNSTRDNQVGLYRKASNGTGAEEFIVRSGTMHAYDWSGDGKFLLVASMPSPGSQRDLYAVAAEGEHKLIPLVASRFRDDQGQFSPDGKWLAYKSNETGRDEVYVQPVLPGAKGERWLVSQEGGTMPRWSHDGKELYFFAGSRLMVTPVATLPTFHAGLPKVLFDSHIAGRGGNAYLPWDVTPDGKRFIVITDDSPVQRPLTVVLNWQAALRR